MRVTDSILTLMLCAVCVVSGDESAPALTVAGDVPKPGPLSLENGMTMDSAMAKAGMDLRPFYADEIPDDKGPRCPIKIEVYRDEKKTIYDPSLDSAALRQLKLVDKDTIEVTDFRKHPEKIEERKKRLEKMLILGSIEIMSELLELATLQYEYDNWLGQSGEEGGSAPYVKKEATRLCSEGKGQRVVAILELKLGALELDGLGPAHPTIQSTKSLTQVYRDLIAK
jgi:hypothetical protein